MQIPFFVPCLKRFMTGITTQFVIRDDFLMICVDERRSSRVF